MHCCSEGLSLCLLFGSLFLSSRKCGMPPLENKTIFFYVSVLRPVFKVSCIMYHVLWYISCIMIILCIIANVASFFFPVFYLLAVPHGRRDLSSPARDQTPSPWIGCSKSLPLDTREVPTWLVFVKSFNGWWMFMFHIK